jgi:hypothetical protein
MKEIQVSRRPSLTTTTTTMTSQGASEPSVATVTTVETPGATVATGATTTTSAHQRKRFSASTAARIIGALHDLERIEDVVTISAIARRTGVSRPTVRAVLQQECGWTATQSCRAHHAGVRRGTLLQAVAGHPGLAHGRATLQSQGWPNLQRAHHAAQVSAYPALQRGRETQATLGWPGLRAVHQARSTTGYPHLARGRANLAARGWPNWQRAQDVLKAQDYLPLVDAQRLRKHEGPAPPQQTDPETDRRRLRGRATRLAILETLQTLQAGPVCQVCQAYEDQRAPEPLRAGTSALASTGASARASARHVTVRALAAHLQLHPATVYAHLQQIRRLAAQEMQETRESKAEGPQ